ncbi:hypothetical protein [uncultured Acetobacteroides sp.]|uniref:hypothetical protein n=1 Tax=uncultured Acetobacteroides sp. TaxID=1760811 RepID=UPI0029F461EA|nr:hypothetical protein [uncultured Acetobacteroides sp.]
MQTEITKDIQTESGEDEFQIRLIKFEGFGLLTSKRGRNCFDNEQLYNMTLIENGM